MKHVIYALDNDSDAAEIAALLKAGDYGNVVECFGSYKGEEEISYICTKKGFDAVIRAGGYVDEQESILLLSGCNKQYVDIMYLETGVTQGLGCMHSTTDKAVAMQQDGWTYRKDMKTYFYTAKGNPDKVHGDPFDEERQAADTATLWVEGIAVACLVVVTVCWVWAMITVDNDYTCLQHEVLDVQDD